MTTATIVMYHLVHPAGPGILEQLKGLDRREFAEQVSYIRRHYTPVQLNDLAGAVTDELTLPPNPVVLTFDDGYACHARVVAPILADAGVPATFFPVASALLDRAVLNVNKIQSILAVADVQALVARIESAIDRDTAGASAGYRNHWFKASRWDPPDVVYVKRLLQHALPDKIREPLVDELFRTLVTTDERAFADDLYMTVGEVQQLASAGMTIGAHADRHVRLPLLSRDDQATEIDGALRVLDAAGVSTTRFVYSYANGAYNDDSIELLRERGCAVAVSTRPDLAMLVPEALLTLPRLDTNDLPVSADAEPNEWTRLAAARQSA
jgi:peptidoglycan/xylan/chitin deacetylase (PgdA/CDA1 family)